LKISKKLRKEYEINFDSKYTALTFALPLKKGVARNGQKIFESWETIALYPDSHRDKNKKVSQAKYIRFDTLILEN